MHHAACHAHAHNAETSRAIQYVHNCQAEQTACKGVYHAENPGEQQSGTHDTHTVDCKGVLEPHSINGNYNHQVGKPQLYAGNGNRQRNQKFHIGKNYGKGGEHGSEGQSPRILR